MRQRRKQDGEKEEQLLIDLTTARGVPGNEEEVREVFKEYAKDFAEDIFFDGLGSVIAKHVGDGGGPKIFISGHMDEVGFMVTKITEKGFIEFQTLGGWWGQVMLAQQVEIKTNEGKLIHGVVGSKPPHVLSPETRNKPYDIKDMFIDIGASSEEEAKGWGIRPGDMITPYIQYKRMNDSKFLLAKAWDNRIGTAVSLRVLETLAAEGHPNCLFAGSDVMEEVEYKRGANKHSLSESRYRDRTRYWYRWGHTWNDTKRSGFCVRQRPTSPDFRCFHDSSQEIIEFCDRCRRRDGNSFPIYRNHWWRNRCWSNAFDS